MLNRRWRYDEQGSMVLAVTVLGVLLLLTVGVLARSLGSQNQVRRNQDFNAGLASADGGLADALYQLDQDPPASIYGPSGAFSNTVTVGNGTFSYSASKKVASTSPTVTYDDNKYIIHSIGTVNGVKHGVLATARRRQLFDFVMFANRDLKVAGNCSTFQGPVGGAGLVELATGCIPEVYCFLSPITGAPVISKGCGDYPGQTGNNLNGRRVNETNPKPPVTIPSSNDTEWFPIAPGTAGACPWQATGTITGVISGQVDAAGRNGYYRCDRSAGFTLSGNITVNDGPVRIYIMSGAINSIASSTLINCQPVCRPSTNPPPPGRPPAANFQLFVGSPVDSNVTFPGSSDVNGAINAPRGNFTFQPAAFYTGSLIAQDVTVNGAPNLGYLDQSLKKITVESWRITDYKEVPSSCPITSTTC